MNESSINIAAEVIMGVVPPTILVIGTICNVLSVAVLSRPSLGIDSNTIFLLKVLAVTDTIALHTGAWVQFVKVWLRWMDVDYAMEASTDQSCKVYNYIYCIMRTYTVWVLVLVTCERLIFTVAPLKSSNVLTRRNMWIALITILATTTLIYIPVLFSFKRILYGFGPKDEEIDIALPQCGPEKMTMFWVDSILRIILPFCVLLICNIVIICTLNRSHKKRRSISAPKLFKVESRKLRLLTALLLVASFAHLILTLPNLVYILPYFLHHLQYYSDADLANQAESQHMLWAVLTCLLYIDESLNFLLYCISGKIVRNEFFSMICCKKRNGSDQNGFQHSKGRSDSISSCRSRYMSLSLTTYNNPLIKPS